VVLNGNNDTEEGDMGLCVSSEVACVSGTMDTVIEGDSEILADVSQNVGEAVTPLVRLTSSSMSILRHSRKGRLAGNFGVVKMGWVMVILTSVHSSTMLH